MKIPQWLKCYLKVENLPQIEEAIRKAETKTSGEVVPMIVRRSSTTGHVPMIVTLLLTTLYFGLDLYHWQLTHFHVNPAIVIAANVIVLALLIWTLSSLSVVQRLLTPKQDQLAQVQQRAINEFYQHRVHHTKESTGILIFVSLLEHQAIVMGDEPIAKKLPQEKWQSIVNDLVGSIRSRKMAEGFTQAIATSGQLLEQHFPIRPGDRNELKNHLVIKE